MGRLLGPEGGPNKAFRALAAILEESFAPTDRGNLKRDKNFRADSREPCFKPWLCASKGLLECSGEKRAFASLNQDCLSERKQNTKVMAVH